MSSLSAFAFLFGLRFWVVALPPTSFTGLPILQKSIDYIIVFPAMATLYEAGVFGKSRRNRFALLALLLIAFGIVASTTKSWLIAHQVLNIVVVASSLALLFFSHRQKQGPDASRLQLLGLWIFIVPVVVENVAQLSGSRFAAGWGLFGFAAFIVILTAVVLRDQVRASKALIEFETEIQLARGVQQSLLPAKLPHSDRFRVAALFNPLNKVAGDFYDIVLEQDQAFSLLVADVSGHGMPAALIASMVKLAVSAHKRHGDEPAKLLSAVNTTLIGNTKGQFVTAVYILIRPELNELCFAGAGHPPILLLRNDSVIELIENGMMLGLFDFAAYSASRFSLQNGDRLALFTDGLPEAENPRGQAFGIDGLSEALKQTANFSAAEACKVILEKVHRWSPIPADDQTLVLVDYL